MNAVSNTARLFPVVLIAVAVLRAQPGVAPILREGAPVVIAFTEDLSSKNAVKSDPVHLKLASNLTVDNVLVAKAGARVVAHLASVKKAAAPGKSGEIQLQLDYLDAGNAKVQLRGEKAKANENTIQYSRPFHLKWPMGLFRTGDDVEINAGTTITVFVANDVAFSAAR